MIHSSKSCLIVLSLVCLAACQDVSSEEASARAIFSNYTSGLLALTTVNSTTYSLIRGGFCQSNLLKLYFRPAGPDHSELHHLQSHQRRLLPEQSSQTILQACWP